MLRGFNFINKLKNGNGKIGNGKKNKYVSDMLEKKHIEKINNLNMNRLQNLDIDSKKKYKKHIVYTSLLHKYSINVTIIQKIYRGYKCRRILNNIYKKLPDDLKSYIIHKYLRRDYYDYLYNKNLSTIINKKIYDNINFLIFELNTANDAFLKLIKHNSYYVLKICYYIECYYVLVDNVSIYTMRLLLNDFRDLIIMYYHAMFYNGMNDNSVWTFYLELKSLANKMELMLYPNNCCDFEKYDSLFFPSLRD